MDRNDKPKNQIEELGAELVPGSGFEDDKSENDEPLEDEE